MREIAHGSRHTTDARYWAPGRVPALALATSISSCAAATRIASAAGSAASAVPPLAHPGLLLRNSVSGGINGNRAELRLRSAIRTSP